MSIPFSPHSRQHLSQFVFLMVAILTGVRWTLNEVLICISFVARNVEHFFMSFWPLELFPLKKFCSIHLAISSLAIEFLKVRF
jgi:hypothetical protein